MPSLTRLLMIAVLWLAFPLSAVGQTAVLNDTLWTYGSLSEAEGPTLGHVVAAVRVGDGRYVVADEQQSRLFLVNPAVGPLDTLGRRGEGPGEFGYIGSVDALEGGRRVVVADRSNFRLSFLGVAADSLVYEGSTRLPLDPKDLCTFGDLIYVLGAHRGRMIHHVSASGEIRRSFGSYFHSDSVIGASVDLGKLVCDEEYRRIYVSNAEIPQVRAYTDTGKFLWETELPDFQHTVLTRSERGGVTHSAPEGGGPADLTVTTVAWRDGKVMVQYGPLRGSHLDAIVPTTTVWLDGRSGRIVGQRGDFPRVDDVYGSVAVSRVHLPYPQVLWYQLDEH